MSGFGERFRRAGYKIPKPLIEVGGKPIIAHVIDLFPGEDDFTFICNEDHLSEEFFCMEETIKNYCPSAKIYSIKPHKLGPINAVMQIFEKLRDDKPTIVNYCDFSCIWDWKNFKEFVNDENCIGCIPAYKGFHPHSLGKTNYAYIRDESGIVEDIQEKEPFTSNKMNEFASSGTYYFSSGSKMKESFNYAISEGLNTEGEFYVSLAYKYFIKKHEKVSVYPLQHFMQWGTPQDLDEFNYWFETFKMTKSKKNKKVAKTGSTIIPMAGMGKRFSDEGYLSPKPLIDVSGSPMFVQATQSLPDTENHIFVTRSDLPNLDSIKTISKKIFPSSEVIVLDKITDGQARTVSVGVDKLREINKNIGSITVGTCDSGFIYDEKKLQNLVDIEKKDLIVWVIKGYKSALENPKMYGWVSADKNKNIKSIAVKEILNNPKDDYVITGAFTFASLDIMENCLDSLFKRNQKVNNEFYLDSIIEDAIEIGYSCSIFEVDKFLCWGTPNNLKTYNYWQSCFHKWIFHEYTIKDDLMIEEKSKDKLIKDIYEWDPKENI